MWNKLFRSPPAWILSRRLSSFQRFFELGAEESLSPFLDNRAKKISRNLAFKSAIAAAVLLVMAFICFLNGYMPISNIALCFVYLFVGTPALIAATQDVLVQKDVNIDVLTTLAAFGALVLGNPLEGALLLVLFALAGSLEDVVTLKAKSALSSLHEMRPTVAYVEEEGGGLFERAVEDVRIGEVVVVRSGEIVPLDGIVQNAGASVDLSHMTGESTPIHVKTHDAVASGARVLQGCLNVQVSCTNSDSTITRLIRLIAKAHTSKPQLAVAFERYGRLYAVLVILISCVLAFLLPIMQDIAFLGAGGGLVRSISFLIAASPCALIIAIPITYLSALGSAAKKGAVLKSWTVLDHLRACKSVAFDKTGTLTTGKLLFCRMIPLTVDSEVSSQAELLAASLEKYAVHPVAEALVLRARQQGHQLIEMASIEVIPGSGISGIFMQDGKKMSAFIGGVEAACVHLSEEQARQCRSIGEQARKEGKIVCVLVIDRKEAVVFLFDDLIREESRSVVEKLLHFGKKVYMLSGDNQQSAEKIANMVGIQDVYAHLRPEDKLGLVERLSRTDGLLMVGDGINDAPALARSTVGVSMGQLSSASARESSDIVLLNNELDLIPWLFSKADKTWTIVRQNLTMALCAIIVGTVGSIEGYMPLWAAVCIHEGSTLIVGLNALRLLLV